MKVTIFTVLIGLSLIFYQNCGSYEPAGKEMSSSSGDVLGNVTESQSITAYKLTLASLIKDKCGECHGINQEPMFALQNDDQSHGVLINGSLVNLDNPNLSKIVQKVSTGNHSGIPSNVSTDLRLAIEDWATRLSLM